MRSVNRSSGLPHVQVPKGQLGVRFLAVVDVHHSERLAFELISIEYTVDGKRFVNH